MKTVSSVAQMLLGVLFTVFGLNGFLHFIPMGPPPTGLAGQYLGALAVSHYLPVVFAFQLASGILLLANRYVPLALAILARTIRISAVFSSSASTRRFHSSARPKR